jgi:LAS superfamily LD-carboxypeptidase LdcB
MRKRFVTMMGISVVIMIALFLSMTRIQLYIKETTIPNYKQLTEIGYDESQIELINEQDQTERDKILLEPYQADIVKILTVKHYAELKDIGYSSQEIDAIVKADDRVIQGLLALPRFAQWRRYIDDTVYRSIIDQGYPDQSATILAGLPTDVLAKILAFGYRKEYEALLSSKYTVLKDLESYLAYWKSHPALTMRNLQEIVNTESDRAPYTGIRSADVSKGILTLVNKYFRFASSYVPAKLTTTKVCGSATLASEASKALGEMCGAMISEGLHPKVTSSYRSFQTQTLLYNRYAAQDGKAQADTYSARPGHSEHQSGYVVDMITGGSSLSTFKNTAEYRWMVVHAASYGFILRYSASKQAITGYIGEPWHWRYVGKEIAADYNAKGMTFDEYYRLYIEN